MTPPRSPAVPRAGAGSGNGSVGGAAAPVRSAVQPAPPPGRGADRSVVHAPQTEVSEVEVSALQAQVRERLLTVGVSSGAIRLLEGRWTHWSDLADWLPRRTSWTDKDVAALASLPGLGLEMEEMADWVRLGPIEAGLRLTLRGILPDRLRQFPLDGKHGSDAFLKMLQVTDGTGMHVDDLLWWHTAGVLSLSRPYLNKDLWPRWRSVGATRIGLRRAALAAAAGLSPEAAIAAVAAGEDDETAWRMLASLRVGQHL